MSKKKKTLLVIALSIFLFGAGVTVTGANSSISGVLSEWLSGKTEESIEEIDQAIDEEQIKQTERLKEVLAEEIAEVEKEWDVFLEEEKEKQRNRIIEHADMHIENFSGLDEEDMTLLQDEIQAITDAALEEIEEITVEKIKEGGSENEE
jgi:hypothetical protein